MDVPEEIPEHLRTVPQVDVYLEGTDDILMSIKIDLTSVTDEVLSNICVDELCVEDGPFCSHCIGGDVTFNILRSCNHKICIFPLQQGLPLKVLTVNAWRICAMYK